MFKASHVRCMPIFPRTGGVKHPEFLSVWARLNKQTCYSIAFGKVKQSSPLGILVISHSQGKMAMVNGKVPNCQRLHPRTNHMKSLIKFH